jgi:hypothetical protein
MTESRSSAREPKPSAILFQSSRQNDSVRPGMPDEDTIMELFVLVGIIVVIGMLLWNAFRS